MFSWVTAVKDDLLVTGVWESRRAFEQFASEFGARAAEVGVRAPPQVTIHEIHSHLTSG